MCLGLQGSEVITSREDGLPVQKNFFIISQGTRQHTAQDIIRVYVAQ